MIILKTCFPFAHIAARGQAGERAPISLSRLFLFKFRIKRKRVFLQNKNTNTSIVAM